MELPNWEVIKKILHLYFGENKDSVWEDYVIDNQRRGQDVRYSIDDTKLKALGWQPKANFDLALVDIVSYYRKNFVW